MKRKGRLPVILRSRTGASFILVLAVMLLLMAIGVSVLVAASANVGFAISQKTYNQLITLDNSIHKNILYSLQHDPSDGELLSVQLVKAIYDANSADDPSKLEPVNLDMELDNGFDFTGEGITVKNIRLSFPTQNVAVKAPVGAIPDGGKPREPKTAEVSAVMTVIVEISVKGKLMTSSATYEYTGGKLTDDKNGEHKNETGENTYNMEFAEDGYGQWRLIRHEKLDS